MKFLIIDLRKGFYGVRKTNFIGPFWIALSNQGMVNIVNVNERAIHIKDDTWTPVQEVNER